MYVCNTAIEKLGDSDQFPEDWLFKHRWNKGKKGNNALPNGAKITFITVGGRTSAVVPSVQKKTGAVAGDVSQEAMGVEGSEEDDKPKKGGKRKKNAVKAENDDEDEAEVSEEVSAPTKRSRKKAKQEEDEDAKPVEKPAAKKQSKAAKHTIPEQSNSRKRRSGRLTKV